MSNYERVERTSAIELTHQLGVGTAEKHPLVAVLLNDEMYQFTANEAMDLSTALVKNAGEILKRKIIPISELIKDPDEAAYKLYSRIYKNYSSLRDLIKDAADVKRAQREN